MGTDTETRAPRLSIFGQQPMAPSWDQKINRVVWNLAVAAVVTFTAAGLCVSVVVLMIWAANWALT